MVQLVKYRHCVVVVVPGAIWLLPVRSSQPHLVTGQSETTQEPFHYIFLQPVPVMYTSIDLLATCFVFLARLHRKFFVN